MFRFLVFISALTFLISFASSDTEMTITVDPGNEYCFYQPLNSGSVFEIDYQVIDGGQGELDISFYLRNPEGVPLIMDYKRPENSHRVDIPKQGDYMFCFDNRFSSFNRKTVFFALIEDDSEDSAENVETASEEQYEIAIENIEQVLARVKEHLVKIRHMQETARALEARDRNIAEGNYTMVNVWSLLQIMVMIVVGAIQVVMVKSLFDENSQINKLFRRGFSIPW